MMVFFELEYFNTITIGTLQIIHVKEWFVRIEEY